jgi:hypothetical protein
MTTLLTTLTVSTASSAHRRERVATWSATTTAPTTRTKPSTG